MKPRNQFAQYMLRALLIMLPITGVYIANRTYQYEVIVKGILGCVVLYLLFYYLKSSKTDLSFKDMLRDPKILNHLTFVFIAPIIAYWATGGVFDMISLLAENLIEFLK
jgi:hypothetical protein